MSFVLSRANPAEDPLGDVTLQMHQQIADAVATLIGASPECLAWQRLDAMPQLDRILLDEPVPGPRDEIVGDRHQAVFASEADSVSRKTSSASSTLPNGAETCTPCTCGRTRSSISRAMVIPSATPCSFDFALAMRIRSMISGGTTTPGTSLARNSALRSETSGQMPATIGMRTCS